MHEQGVELAVGFGVEVVYWQQVVTTIGEEQSLALEGAIVSSDAHKAIFAKVAACYVASCVYECVVWH